MGNQLISGSFLGSCTLATTMVKACDLSLSFSVEEGCISTLNNHHDDHSVILHHIAIYNIYHVLSKCVSWYLTMGTAIVVSFPC